MPEIRRKIGRTVLYRYYRVPELSETSDREYQANWFKSLCPLLAIDGVHTAPLSRRNLASSLSLSFFFFFCYCQVKRTTHIRVSQVDICADITSWLLTTILQNHARIIHIHTTIFFFFE